MLGFENLSCVPGKSVRLCMCVFAFFNGKKSLSYVIVFWVTNKSGTDYFRTVLHLLYYVKAYPLC